MDARLSRKENVRTRERRVDELESRERDAERREVEERARLLEAPERRRPRRRRVARERAERRDGRVRWLEGAGERERVRRRVDANRVDLYELSVGVEIAVAAKEQEEQPRLARVRASAIAEAL